VACIERLQAALQHVVLLQYADAPHQHCKACNCGRSRAAVFFGTLALLWLKSWWDMRGAVPLDISAACGDITPDELAKFDGQDPFKPIYFSVQGRVFDVTSGRDFYGPGAPMPTGSKQVGGRHYAYAWTVLPQSVCSMSHVSLEVVPGRTAPPASPRDW